MQQATVNLLSDMGAQPASLQGEPGRRRAARRDRTDGGHHRSRRRRHRRRRHRRRLRHRRRHRRRGRRGRGVDRRRGDVGPGHGHDELDLHLQRRRRARRRCRRGRSTMPPTSAPPTSVELRRRAAGLPLLDLRRRRSPATEVNDTDAVELGVKFRSDVAGFVTGIRFYKTAGNTGTHTGTLWSNAGASLATVTFTGESATGWQEATFDTPVAIEADTTYVASYHTTVGHYAIGTSFATAGVDSPPLHALQDGVDGPNGVYRYGGGGVFPTSTFGSSNYLVDVVFVDEVGPDETAPTIAAAVAGSRRDRRVGDRRRDRRVQRADGGRHDQRHDRRAARPADVLVDATVTYVAGTRTAVLDPDAALASSTTYTATVQGGVGRRHRRRRQRAGRGRHVDLHDRGAAAAAAGRGPGWPDPGRLVGREPVQPLLRRDPPQRGPQRLRRRSTSRRSPRRCWPTTTW